MAVEGSGSGGKMGSRAHLRRRRSSAPSSGKPNEGACRMENLALVSDLSQSGDASIGLLIADDDAALRSLMVAQVEERLASGLAVYEAADGPEAIQLALQRRPQIALLDVNMPRLGGIEVALVLRELLPGLRLALHTGDPAAHGESAREFCLPLFDKLESARSLRWVENQARVCAVQACNGLPRHGARA
jgi:CheY-like chemotaxis protein